MVQRLMLACSPKTNSDTVHALHTEAPRDCRDTYCGRNASEWLDIERQDLDKFLESAYSCRRCIDGILK